MFCGIVGTSYCGSTMLSYMLGSSPDVFSTGELTHGNERLKCDDGWHPGEPCPIWTDSFVKKLIKNKKIRNKLLKKQAKRVLGSKVVVNPDKAPSFYIKSHKNGDDVDFLIFLFKSPHAFAYSFRVHQKNKLGKQFKHARDERLIKAACDSYFGLYHQGLQFADRYKIPYVVLSYDSLATNPRRKLKKLCKHLNVRYYPGMADYWNNSDKLHMVPAGNGGARKQFLSIDEYKKLWSKRAKGGHAAYFKEHSDWFLKNYHKVTVDRKWSVYLTKNEKDIINKHKRSRDMYGKLMRMRMR